ncbi:5807_t:CDS:2, partial [Acaulospora morrowiae]
EIFPINDKEIEREHLRHYIEREVFNGTFSSPVQDILETGWARVLDVNCGPGTWLFELSSDYPGCNYFGTNSSHTISLLNNGGKPFDVEFVDANLVKYDFKVCSDRENLNEQECGLPFLDNSFDFVSMKYSSREYTVSEWENTIIKELIRVLKPGGWLELTDFELTMDGGGPVLNKFLETKLKLLESFHLETDIIHNLPKIMEASGEFMNVQFEIKKFPLGKSSGKLGESGSTLYYETYKSILSYFAKHLGIKEKDINATVDKIKEEFDEYDVYKSAYRIFGQKQLEQRNDEMNGEINARTSDETGTD